MSVLALRLHYYVKLEFQTICNTIVAIGLIQDCKQWCETNSRTGTPVKTYFGGIAARLRAKE